MKVIIGGACQGKLAFAKREYQAADGWVDGQVCKLEEIKVCRGIYHFHEYVRRLMDDRKEGLWFSADQSILGIEQQAERFAELLYEKNPDILIVSNELGCGIVPMEKKDRLWRETCGRICTALAARADEVVRVVCGVGQKLTVQEEAPELVQNKIGKLSSRMMENDGVNDLPASACFPLFLDLSHTHLLVVGAGQIALRRIRALLGFAARLCRQDYSGGAGRCAWALRYPDRDCGNGDCEGLGGEKILRARCKKENQGGVGAEKILRVRLGWENDGSGSDR